MKTAIDLFSGGGGASTGLHQAGFNVVAAIEFDEKIAECHHNNFPKSETIIGSVVDVSFRRFAGIDHIHGSPPCQSFSIAASREAKDKRIANGEQELIFEWVRAIAEIRPATASLENVPPTINSKSFQKACQKLYQLGYWLNYGVYNAADFGVPQSRKRLILRAIADNKLGCLPIDEASQSLFGEKHWWGMVPTKQKWVGWYDSISDIIQDFPDTEPANWQINRLPKELKSSEAKAFLIPRAGARTSDPTLSIRQKHEPAPTIRSLANARSRQLDALLENGCFKAITPRGLARFQSFPDDFVLPKNQGLANKIIGNAVPPLLLKELIKNFA
jgi:DNA (cytosine-5)-methyltransferase 1